MFQKTTGIPPNGSSSSYWSLRKTADDSRRGKKCRPDTTEMSRSRGSCKLRCLRNGLDPHHHRQLQHQVDGGAGLQSLSHTNRLDHFPRPMTVSVGTCILVCYLLPATERTTVLHVARQAGSDSSTTVSMMTMVVMVRLQSFCPYRECGLDIVFDSDASVNRRKQCCHIIADSAATLTVR